MAQYFKIFQTSGHTDSNHYIEECHVINFHIFTLLFLFACLRMCKNAFVLSLETTLSVAWLIYVKDA